MAICDLTRASLLVAFVVALLASCKPQIAEAPVLSPEPGSYATAQSVIITAPATGPGASIRYTTDGSTPTETYGAEYTGVPLDITTTTLLKAVAYYEGGTPSPVVEGTYTIEGTVAMPTVNPGGGSYSATQYVKISTETTGAQIRYTTDGSTPTETYGTVYGGNAITVARTLTVKAIAYITDVGSSMVASTDYTINGRVATPVMTPGAGTYATAQNVTIATTTPGASIRYTTDGSTPTPTDGTLYTAPVSVSSSLTLRAIAYLLDWTDSAIAASAYVIPGKVATPVAAPAAGTYPLAQLVTITTATDGATIRYTLDGTLPSATYGTIYTGPVTVTNTSSLRAIAYNNLWLDSNVLTAAYGIALDSTGNVGQYTGLAMGATTILAVYYDVTNLNLKMAYTTDGGANWPVETIDTVGSVGQYASVTMSGSDVYVSYYDSANQDQRFARSSNGGATWDRQLLDSTGNVGQFTSIAVDGTNVTIAYYDVTGTNAKVARSVDGGDTWALATIADPAASVGQYASVASAAGNYYIAYYDLTNQNLKFSLNGGVPVTINDPAASVGTYTSVAFDGTTYWVAYYDATNGDLKVASSTDPAWPTPTFDTVDSAGITGQYTSIVVAGAEVYVAYFEDLNYNLKLAAWDGLAWSTQTVDTNGVGQYASVAALDGTPDTIAISYYDMVNLDLKLARSTDGGASWSFY